MARPQALRERDRRELATNNGLLVQVGFGDAAVASEFASQFDGATAAGDDQGLAAR